MKLDFNATFGFPYPNAGFVVHRAFCSLKALCGQSNLLRFWHHQILSYDVLGPPHLNETAYGG